ncbi:MAG: 2-C-methyl-D-erythritol 2,4-cyclodiphosphate synthase [Candidatus Fimenecus sp.]
MRIGHGYDVHRLTEGRKLILGGVEIENGEIGLLGHSDADVLLHAISDSLLGACALGDIGKHFPDTDEAFKDADSMELLKKVGEIIADGGYQVNNVDATVIAQSPKLSPFIDEMRNNIANALKIRMDQVSVKATTEEKLGFTGTGEGIAAHSVCLVEETKKIKFI